MLMLDIQRLATPHSVLLQNFQLQVAPGVIHTLMGASGTGKSSLLAAICGSLPEGLTFQGQVSLNGQRIDTLPIEARRVGILFQHDLLFAHMTVRENLLFAVPAKPLGAAASPRQQQAAREAQVQAGLADMAMADFAHANPATLSGGQRARVALLRALLAQPQALLLDEPFSKLDADLRARLRQWVFDHVAARNIPVLLVTHDVADVADPACVTQLAPPP
jgi:putative thiamine transport system ATP-binding protein